MTRTNLGVALLRAASLHLSRNCELALVVAVVDCAHFRPHWAADSWRLKQQQLKARLRPLLFAQRLFSQNFGQMNQLGRGLL